MLIKSILCAGNPLIDYFIKDEACLITNEYNLQKNSKNRFEYTQIQKILMNYAFLHKSAGGGAYNTAKYLSINSEYEVGFCGSIGDDENSNYFIADLNDNGIRNELFLIHNNFTGLCVNILLSDQSKTVLACPCAAVAPKKINIDIALKYDALYLDGFLLYDEGFAIDLVNLFKKNSKKVFFDCGSASIIEYKNKTFKEIFKKADMIFANREEYTKISDGFDAKDALKSTFIASHLQPKTILIVKLDKDGVLAVGKEIDTIQIKASNNIKVIDTTGAGDLLAGAFLEKYGRITLRENLIYGLKRAEEVISRVGIL